MTEKSIPKKIYRHVLKGLQFFGAEDSSGGNRVELISYVFLKNHRIYKPPVVAGWVDHVLTRFKSYKLVHDDQFGNYKLHTLIANDRTGDDENFVLNPEHSQVHNENDSSDESLSAVPHYQKVLKRKGKQHALPKHRMHKSDTEFGDQGTEEHRPAQRGENPAQSNIPFLVKFDSDLNAGVFDVGFEISSDED